ncbi:hypothetical protein AC578_5817 [Pseudocercospora eumusae]|uniref:DUF1640 domain-containing protein n=1 Tax=Pseudocercospora eumusae TaxID=321146 RepID=A0A139HCJ6_9PEZI|nr:hypothetical protein AC578_5817 [Pseudocercospora eumusae]
MAAEAATRSLMPRLAWTASSVRPSTVIAQHATTQWSSQNPPKRTTATAAFARKNWAERRLAPRPSSTTSHAARRAFSATPARAKDHHFDTLKFVQRLQQEGFTEEQAVAMMKVLGDVIEESIQNLTRTMVLREDQEKATYTQKVDFAKLRSELLSADSTESSLTRASHERLSNEVTKLNNRLRDEISRTQASVRLDLNLEKGRIREEANSQDLKIKETETRIEQESAALRERLEAVKFSTLQWLMGVCTGTAAIILGVWRLLM